MKKEWIRSYAHLLVHYCLGLKKGQQVLVTSTFLAEPLLKEFYRETLKAGAHAEFQLGFEDMSEMFYEEADTDQLQHVSPFFKYGIENFDAFLNIRAPYTLENENMDRDKWKIRSAAQKPVMQTYFERLGNGTMRRSLCQWPTKANADLAGMTLEEYGNFIAHACKLDTPDPVKAWEKVRDTQQKYVDYLNNVGHIRYVNGKMDVSFSVKGRTWINSEGRNNMPSGEVFSAPVEDSVQGTAHFDYPSMYLGKRISGITLYIEDGLVTSWQAEEGQDVLDKLFEVEGARRFGEVAIGTNYEIQQPTGNILFDEKIGGTIHMAVGQSYIHCGGKNESAIHLDMIAEMKEDGQIFADDKLIYEKGQFVI